MPCPLPRWTRTGATVGCYPVPLGPSPLCRRVGVPDFTFEACSDFTHVTACGVAQPPKAAFVTRLRPGRLLDQAARQLPQAAACLPKPCGMGRALPTTARVDSSSTGEPRLWGALHRAG